VLRCGVFYFHVVAKFADVPGCLFYIVPVLFTGKSFAVVGAENNGN